MSSVSTADADNYTDPSQIDAGAGVDGISVSVTGQAPGGGRRSGGGSGGLTCEYRDAVVPVVDGSPGSPAVGQRPDHFVEGNVYWLLCYSATGDTAYWRLFSYQPGNLPVSGAQLAVIARGEVALPLPEPQTSPAATQEQLVGVKTWLWVDRAGWTPVSVTAAIPGLSATVTATPARTVWAMGDGTTVRCDGPGTPYETGRSTDCGHVYETVSRDMAGGVYAATVTTVWSVTWTASDGSSGNLGELSRVTPFQLTVGERQATVR